MRRWRDQAGPVLAGLAGLMPAFMGLVAVHGLELPGPVAFRETVFDHGLALMRPVPPDDTVRIVDIDRGTLAAHGAWPWPRLQTAALIAAIAEARPAVIVLDIHFGAPDTRSPAALARSLAAVAPEAGLDRLAGTLPDGDARLAAALALRPAVLGALLDPAGPATPPRSVPVLVRGTPDVAGLWREAGLASPVAVLMPAAAGLGVMSLPGDADGLVRRVPLLTLAGETVVPGLAAEAVRLQAGAPLVVVEGPPETLRLGPHAVALGRAASLRLVPGAAARMAGQSLPAHLVLTDPGLRRGLAGRIVLVGGSAPELGGLRAAPGEPLVASVALQAAAVAQIRAGIAPAAAGWPAEAAAMLAAGGAGLGAALVLPPLAGLAAVLALAAGVVAGAAALIASHALLVDPVPAVAAMLLGFAGTSLAAFARTRRRERRIRESFAQHLSPAIVARIAGDPTLVRLEGEEREVTALFTDIAGFTALTRRAGPRDLVALLDRYFEGVASCIVAEGGMVDKIVGDAVHALFNAPLDLDDHPARALRAAEAILAFTEAFRARPEAAALEFGITRIGLETGLAVVGDVGFGPKLDYTAHGDAVNAAARLEAANKQLGTRLLIGESAAARLPADRLRPQGALTLRGRDEPMAVHDLWPAAADEDYRTQWRAALLAHDTAGFAALAARIPQDEAARHRAAGGAA